MRLLHTADWHVGKTIRGRSRLDEFDRALAEVVEVARDERVDAVLVAGDLYEQRSPAPEADALVFDAFLRLHAAGIPVVAIPGNHDSAVRLGALARLLAPIGVHVVHRPVPPDQGGVVEVPSRDGTEAALVACVPFVPERRFGDAAALFRATEEWYVSYDAGMGRLFGALAEAFRPDRVNLLLAHLFIDRSRAGGGERELTMGMAYTVSASRLPGTAAYAALGHMHLPQEVRGAPCPARYAGSLLQLDFGEVAQEKSVFVVEASPGRPARVRAVPLRGGRALVDLRGTLDDLPRLAEEAGDAYLRVFLETDGPVPGIADRVRDLLPDAVDVQLVYERAAEAPEPGARSLSPSEQFVAYYRAAHGVEPRPDLLEAFHEVYAEVGEEG